MSFNRYRDIALDVEGGRLMRTLLNELDLRSVDLLRHLRATPMSLAGIIYALTPVKPVTITNEHCSIALETINERLRGMGPASLSSA